MNSFVREDDSLLATEGDGNSGDKYNSRSPSGMTTRKTKIFHLLWIQAPWTFEINLEVTQGFGGCGGFVVWVAGDWVKAGAEIGATFERAADDVAGAETDGESEG
jgi:hypothetical protein